MSISTVTCAESIDDTSPLFDTLNVPCFCFYPSALSRCTSFHSTATSCVDNNDALTPIFKGLGDQLDQTILAKGGTLSKCAQVRFLKSQDLDVVQDI